MEGGLYFTYTYTNVVQFLELCIGPLFSESVGFLRIGGVKEIRDGIVHGRPCCENDGKGVSNLSNEPDYDQAGTEKIRMTLPQWRELLLDRTLALRLACFHW